jgi:DNA helicase HerA-like ATPase
MSVPSGPGLDGAEAPGVLGKVASPPGKESTCGEFYFRVGRGAVIDPHALAVTPGLQRFVVAAIFRQLVEERTGGRAVPGLKYLVMLDELNRFAPRGAGDPITRLIETVAAEMRSQGVILLGAQQQASPVSIRVVDL